MIEVGQKLWFVSNSRHRDNKEVTVEKIGRLWATLAHNEGRINVQTLVMDAGNYSSPGRCYISRAEWEIVERRQRVWNELQRHIRDSYHAPRNVTEGDILRAAEALGISLAPGRVT